MQDKLARVPDFAVENASKIVYDSLHRLKSKTYSDGTTPTANFVYDTQPGWGVTLTNPIGRLTEQYVGALATTPAASILGYDAMGRVTLNNQCTPFNCGTSAWPFGYNYDLAGNVTSYSNGVSITFTQSFDTAGRPSGLTSSLNDSGHPATLATVDSTLGYYPPGALRKMSFGNGLTQSNVFNNRLQPCLIDVNNNATTLQTCNDSTPSGNVLDLWMGYSAGTSDNGNVMNWNATGNQSYVRTFTYDSLNRLSTLNQSSGNATGCSSSFSLSWGYDAWGNRTDQNVTSGSCGQFHANVNTQNQLVDPVNNLYKYDAAGNMTNDGNHTYFYDGENRLIQVDGTLGTCSSATACYTYDGLGRRAEKTTGSTKLDYIYDLAGNGITEYCNPCNGYTGWGRGYVYFNGQQIAEYGNGTTYFIHKDHLGSTRLMTAVDQSIYDKMDFLQFGEQIAGSTGTTHKFTGDERDSETNLDHTWFRQYSSQFGRWTSPDPAGLAAVDPTNPQSWNRYSYVSNSPMNYADPSGLRAGCDRGDATCNAEMTDAIFSLRACQMWGCGDGPSCIVNGFAASCGMVFSLLQQGLAGFCPNNDCSKIQTGQNGQFQIYQTTPYTNPDCPASTICVGIEGHWATVNFVTMGDGNVMDIWHCPGCPNTWNGANRMVNAGAIYTAAGITAVVGAPVVVEGTSLANEIVAPHLDTWYGRFGWRMAYIKQSLHRF